MSTLTKLMPALGLVITVFSTSASADTYHHIDQLALDIDRQAKLILRECRHYRHTPEYRHLVSDARELSQWADHLHELAHHHGSLQHMIADVEKIDLQFHHLESVFARAERRAVYGNGHVHGETSHVQRLLRCIEDDIHHLREDLVSLQRPVHSSSPIVTRRPAIHVSPPSNGWGGHRGSPHRQHFGHGSPNFGSFGDRYGSWGRGITIGGGSSRFTIRF